jgi:hypothetical protein
MEITMEKIQGAEAEVTKLQGQEGQTRQAAMADGEIDANEKSELDRILGKINQAKGIVTKLRQEYEANKAVWDGKAGDLSTFESQLGELEAWGHADAPGLRTTSGEIANEASGEQWKAATARLQQAQTDILPAWLDYQEQKAAKEQYEPMRADFDGRLATAAATDLRAEDVVAMIDTLGGAGPALDGMTASLDYKAALAQLQQDNDTLATLENRLTELAAQRDEYQAARDALDAKMAGYEESRFGVLGEMQAQIVADLGAIDAQVAASDYAGAKAGVDTLAPNVDAFIEQTKAQETAQAAYDSAQGEITGRMATVLVSEAAEAPLAAEKRAEIERLAQEAETLAANGDYVAALPLQSQLAEALGGMEEMLRARDEYLVVAQAVDPRLPAYEGAVANYPYLLGPVSKIASGLTEADGAVAAGDYAAAKASIEGVEAALDEADALVSARQSQWEGVYAPLEGRMVQAQACPYAVLKPKADALMGIADKSRAAADVFDFDVADAELGNLDTAITEFEAALKAHEDELAKQIDAGIAPVQAKLPGLGSATSPKLGLLQKMVAEIRAAQTSRTDMEKALARIPEAVKLLADLEKVDAVLKRLSGGTVTAEEARKIIDEQKAAGTLDALPTEARNALAKKLTEGTMTAADHAAMQDLWSKRHIDGEFDKIDKATRDKMVNAFAGDPKVKDLEKDWPTLTDDEKKERIKHIASVVCGPEGWGIDLPKVDTYKKGKVGSTISYGTYNRISDELNVNIDSSAIDEGFDELVATVAHELGHKYQAKLMKQIDDGVLNPGDANYDQAMAFKLHETYKGKANSAQWKAVYTHSPKESHSRQVDDDMKAGLHGKGLFVPPAGGGGGHGHP